MRLLYVVTRAEYFLSHRLSLAQDATAKGFNVAVATTNFSENGRKNLTQISDFFIRFRRGGVNPINEIKTIIDLFSVFKKYRPSIVHNVGLKPSLYCALISRFYGVSSVNSINGFGYIFTSDHLKARLLKPFVRFALKLSLNHSNVTVIVQNYDDYRDSQKLLPKCNLALVAGSGVDVQVFSPNPHYGVFTFTLVSRMLWSKGVSEFVEAARLFKKDSSKTIAKFLLVGSPDPENPESVPVDILKKWHDEKIIEWIEHTDKVADIYHQTSVAVLPSYREGMPKSLLEAMACGLPVITTYARGCDDLVQDGVDGLKVPVRGVVGLYYAMQKCYEDRTLCEAMGHNARNKIINSYSSDIVNGEIINIYSGLQVG